MFGKQRFARKPVLFGLCWMFRKDRWIYQCMWLEGVALATNQIPTADLIGGGPSYLHTAGSLFYHGAQGGVEVTW